MKLKNNIISKYNLTADQFEAWDKINLFIDDIYKPFFVLEGYAGTGKTYLITRLIDYFVTERKYDIAVTAPTNKAVKVLFNQSLNQKNKKIDFATTHSILGLREEVDGFGNINFVLPPDAKPKLDEYKLLFVDEASMINKTLFN